MRMTTPNQNDTFMISSAPEWPSIPFATDAAGAHTWNWTLTWGAFRKSGSVNTTGNSWDANEVIGNCGGSLTVRAEANRASATISVKIRGSNPSAAEVRQYLSSKTNSVGFDKIIEHESRFRHFNQNNEPVKSFDNGYGMCQLTNPAPGFDQVWNWKLNVDGGLKLFEQKRTGAIAYLAQSGRTYTADQLRYEAVCRWNGGSYHEWDAKSGNWVRPTNILCDTQTGNIGWDMNDPSNQGKTEVELRNRDSGEYSSRPAGAKWNYSGVCYADRVLG